MWPIFESGARIVVTEDWHGHLWSASPHWVVESDSESLVTYHPAGTTSVLSSNRGMAYTQGMSRSERKLAALRTLRAEPRCVSETPSKLYVYTPESWARVNLGWDPDDGHFMGWYVNFERPARRTDDGLSSKDLLLDLYIKPNHSWEWKDRDEFAIAVERQIIESDLIETLEAEAERVLAQAATSEGAFDPRWQSFRPPQSWGRPELPREYLADGRAWIKSTERDIQESRTKP